MTDADYGHTGRELELMLSGVKPLSMFYDDPNELPDERIIPEEELDAHVASGMFVKGTKVFDLALHPQTGKPVQVRYVLYAPKGEAWRIPAMFLTIETSLQVQGPNEAIDRITSKLLGYSDADIEAHYGYKRKC